MPNHSFELLREFLAQKIGWPEDKIRADSRIYLDLGVYGDDATELLSAYGKQFHVDVSNFMAADYFDDECHDLVGPILRMFRVPRQSDKKVLAVEHLEMGIREGRLDEAVINYGREL